MPTPVPPSPAFAELVALLAQRAAAGADQLAAGDRRALLAGIGIEAAGVAPLARVSLTHTRDFGSVIGGGVGGADADLDRSCFARDRAWVAAAAPLTVAADFLEQFRRTVGYQRLAAGGAPIDAALLALFDRLLALAAASAPSDPAATMLIEHLQLELACGAGGIVAVDVACSVGRPAAPRLPRPIAKIDKLLHPKTIGIVGVSATSMNFGRIILHNLVGSGYPKAQLRILRPGEAEIDGVRCVDSLAALPEKLDLLIVAVPGEAVHELVDEIIATDSVESVMLIPGGLGETEKSREPAAALAARINAAHGKAGGGPIFLGANCLGVVSHPGNYDSWFIPLERLPKPQKKPVRNSVLLSQSGAFMITRLSQNPWLDPRYMLALGNQTDLTHGDLLSYFAERDDIATIGLYIEGFKDLDGLDFARAIRRAVQSGKTVVAYKSGKTPAGAAGVMGHTASIAGDPALFESVLRQAGAIVAEDFNTFDDLFYIAGALHDKTIAGNRLGALSGAGFEAVGMADSTVGESFAMSMGNLESATIERVQAILAAKRLNTLVEVRNPIDINPGADDEAHLQITEAFADDPNIDAIVVGLDPTAPAVRALESSVLRPGFDISDAKSSVNLMPPLVARIAKPIVGIIDGGRLYDAMAAGLMDRGVCIFRNCARGTRALVRYVEARQRAAAIRTRY